MRDERTEKGASALPTSNTAGGPGGGTTRSSAGANPDGTSEQPKRPLAPRIAELLGWACVVVFAVAVGFLAFANVRLRVVYADFYAASEPMFEIPDINGNFVPQDLFYYALSDEWVFSGHGVHGAPSVLAKRAADGSTAVINLQTPDGHTYWGHGAAIPYAGKWAYLSADNGYYVLNAEDVAFARNGDTVRAQAYVKLGFTPAFMVVQNGMLYAGVFYQDQYYKTPAEMHIVTPTGQENRAVMYAFRLDDAAPYGVASTPERVYSIPGLVQGIAFTDDGRLALACSWGTSESSHLLLYDTAALKDDGIYDVAGKAVPLTCLDERSLTKDLLMPPMLEGIEWHGGRIWTSNEAASNEFVYGKLDGLGMVYAIDVG